MGQLVSHFKESGSVAEMITRTRKRNRTEVNSSNEESESEVVTPKKKRLLTTTQYIYQALFKEEKNSDITMMALGKVWHLHKLYLCQSPYFYSMFNGSWKEANESFVHIKIVDSNITLDALQAVFGSLYSDEIEIDQKIVVSILATATLFQMEGIIEKCVEVMIEATHAETAVSFYEAGCEYGIAAVKKAAFEWLETNILSIYNKEEKYLSEIGTELMAVLISSPDLYVLQTEFSLYQLLRSWMYIKLFPKDGDESNQKKNKNNTPQTYFGSRKDMKSFLLTKEGSEFAKPFEALRIPYLINHVMDLQIIIKDNIIPMDMINPYIFSHWNSILKIDHSSDKGLQKIDDSIFETNCMRCGRVLLESGYQKWRWTGFNFGLDLILITDSGVLSIRRHHRADQGRLLSVEAKRQFMIKVRVTSYNTKRQRTFTQNSGILTLSLDKNEEISLMVMDPKVVNPLLISVNLLVINPDVKKPKENTLSNVEASQIPISEIGASSDVTSNQQETVPSS